MKFSDKVSEKAIISLSHELAWKKADVFDAINELTENNIAILGGDVWAVMKVDEKLSPVTFIDQENICVGIIKGKDGEDYVFNWYSDKKVDESWTDYVLRSKIESIDAINNLNAEETVATEFTNSIFYNLVFTSQSEFESLPR